MFEASSSQVYSLDYINQRQVFYNKVFFFFGLAIALSALGVYTGFRYALPLFVQNPLLMWGLFILELGLIFTSRIWSQRRPLNYFCFGLFAFTTGITLVPLLASFILEFGPGILTKALLATTTTFLATALIGWTAHRSFAGLRSFLFVSLIGLIIVSLLGLFIPWNNTMEMVVSGAGVVIFSGFVMYDVQRLKQYPEQYYIDAALALYLNIFNLFIFLLRLLGGLSRR